MGAAVSFGLSQTIMKRANPPYRLLIHGGAFINTLSVIALPWVVKLPLEVLRPLLVVQLLVWAFGQFVSNLPANAIVRRQQTLLHPHHSNVHAGGCCHAKWFLDVTGDGADLWKESQQRLRVHQHAFAGGNARRLRGIACSVELFCTLYTTHIFECSLCLDPLVPCVHFGRNRGNQAPQPVILECGA